MKIKIKKWIQVKVKKRYDLLLDNKSVQRNKDCSVAKRISKIKSIKNMVIKKTKNHQKI